jgi:hypothetical protein
MVKLTRYMHETRQYAGEKSANELLRWINSASANRPAIRLLVMMARERARTVEPVSPERVGRPLRALAIPDKLKSRFLKNGFADRYRQEVADDINGLLSQYRLTPRLLGSVNDRCWTVDWQSANKRVKPQEAAALLSLLGLASQGLLSRIRQCANCRQWFFARFEHKKFDSKRCQQEAFRSKPERREKRRQYMKALRRQQKGS